MCVKDVFIKIKNWILNIFKYKKNDTGFIFPVNYSCTTNIDSNKFSSKQQFNSLNNSDDVNNLIFNTLIRNEVNSINLSNKTLNDSDSNDCCF